SRFGSLIEKLNTIPNYHGDPVYQLSMVNSLWRRRGLPFRPEFLDILTRNYKGGLNEADFQTDPEGARRVINEWVEQETRQKIKDLIPFELITALTRLVIVNAVYFKASWHHPFEGRTWNEAFMTGSGQKVNVPMMHQQEHFRYGETDDAQILDLPYV